MSFAFARRQPHGLAGSLASLVLALMLIWPLAACAAGDDRAVLHTSTGDHEFTVEIAETAAERNQGLMFRQELADNAGMLFDFQEDRPTSFWMRNTFIPLDMIFIGSDGIVRNIHENAIPHDPTGIPSDGPVRFVLEIAGGRAREIGLMPGDRLEHVRVGQPAPAVQ